MAGRRQHFIPRFLQRGFNSRTDAHEAFPWTFMASGKVFRTSVSNIGVEPNFYTGPGDTTVDDEITAAEGSFATLVKDLRDGKADVTDPAIPRLLAHLEVRTRSLRKSFTALGERWINLLLDAFCDEEHLVRLVTRHVAEHPERIAGDISNAIGGAAVPPHILAQFQAMMPDLMPTLVASMLPGIKTQIALLRPMLGKQLLEAARAGHMRALRQSIHPDERVASFASLTFDVVRAPQGTLVLGDSAVVLFTDRSPAGRPISDKGDSVHAVALPISPTQMLIGTTGARMPAEEEVRHAAITCSLEYFIAADETDDNRAAIRKIGLAASPLTDAETEAVMAEVLGLKARAAGSEQRKP